VLVRRDPEGFVVSLRHHGDRLDGRWRRALDRPWRHPLLSALAWRGYSRSIERAHDRYGNRTVLVESRNLRDHPEQELARVQRFLRLAPQPLDRRDLGANSSFCHREREPARPEDLFWLKLVAGRTMHAAGYEPRGAPFSGRILASFATLPVSLAFAAVRLPRMVPGSFRAYLAGWLRSPDRGHREPAVFSQTGGTPARR
jgi:hypothetical protein